MSLQVQGTNDSSIVSKHSIVQQGYFKDNYIHHFVNKQSRRAPLINLGYYVRAVIIEKVLLEFIKNLQQYPVQILSLGAGFDTSFFRLSDVCESQNLEYFEIDLIEVVKRKAAIIKSANNLSSKLNNIKVSFGGCGIWSDNYHLMAADLRNLSELITILRANNFDFQKRTLVLSECSITYMDEKSSRALIELTGKLLQDAVFITYEQICPDGGFGTVMISHFETINSPLLSVTSYPSLKDQERRFLNNGWQECNAMTAWDAFLNSTTEEERFRAISLEPFDEWEEWHLKCNHYTIVIAGNGCLCDWTPFPGSKISSPLDRVVYPDILLLEFHWHPRIKVFGHNCIMFGKNEEYMLIIGGFGQLDNAAHCRLKNIKCFKLNEDKFQEIDTYITDGKMFNFMHHSCTILNNHESSSFEKVTFILYGGRESPLSCVNDMPKLVDCKFNDALFIETKNLIDTNSALSQESSSSYPEPRWRHSACIIDFNLTQTFLVFGGCSKNLKVFNDFWSIDLNNEEKHWLEIRCPEFPCGRFSHSVSVIENCMYLSGGINDKFEALSDIWVWDISTGLWKELKVFEMMPRYGHTSHIISDDERMLLILIGGVVSCRGTWQSVSVIDLISLTSTEYKSSGLEPSKSIMLQNHSSILRKDKKSIYVVGGGGNCFSFGTKFNSFIVEIPLARILGS